jgi:hypothetical protein
MGFLEDCDREKTMTSAPLKSDKTKTQPPCSASCHYMRKEPIDGSVRKYEVEAANVLCQKLQ